MKKKSVVDYINPPKVNKKRVSIYLDPDKMNHLEKLAEKYHTTKSEFLIALLDMQIDIENEKTE